MKIIHISDTHTNHHNIAFNKALTQLIHESQPDVIIHSGDFTNIGRKSEVVDFCQWFSKLAIPNKIFIAGNHDRCFDPKYGSDSEFEHPSFDESNPTTPPWLQDILKTYSYDSRNLIYLENSSVIIDGVCFYGTPWTPWYGGDFWAFNYHRQSDKSKEIIKNIPSSIDVLITHGPPSGILDFVVKRGLYDSVGCSELMHAIETKMSNIKLHCFGHIHEGYGQILRLINDSPVLFNNGSTSDIRYQPINPPILIEL